MKDNDREWMQQTRRGRDVTKSRPRIGPTGAGLVSRMGLVAERNSMRERERQARQAYAARVRMYLGQCGGFSLAQGVSER